MVQLRLLLRGDELEEAVQALPLIRVELPREVEQTPHIRHALSPARLGEQQRFVMRLREDVLQAIGQRAEAQSLPPHGEAGEEGCGFGEEWGGGRSRSFHQHVPEQSLIVLRAEGDEFLQRHRHERRTQHGQQREVLQRVVEKSEQVQQVPDFKRLVEAAASRVQRHSRAMKLLREALHA